MRVCGQLEARVKQAKQTPPPPTPIAGVACPGPTAFGDLSFKNCGLYLLSYFYSSYFCNQDGKNLKYI